MFNGLKEFFEQQYGWFVEPIYQALRSLVTQPIAMLVIGLVIGTAMKWFIDGRLRRSLRWMVFTDVRARRPRRFVTKRFDASGRWRGVDFGKLDVGKMTATIRDMSWITTDMIYAQRDPLVRQTMFDEMVRRHNDLESGMIRSPLRIPEKGNVWAGILTDRAFDYADSKREGPVTLDDVVRKIRGRLTEAQQAQLAIAVGPNIARDLGLGRHHPLMAGMLKGIAFGSQQGPDGPSLTDSEKNHLWDEVSGND